MARYYRHGKRRITKKAVEPRPLNQIESDLALARNEFELNRRLLAKAKTKEAEIVDARTNLQAKRDKIKLFNGSYERRFPWIGMRLTCGAKEKLLQIDQEIRAISDRRFRITGGEPTSIEQAIHRILASISRSEYTLGALMSELRSRDVYDRKVAREDRLRARAATQAALAQRAMGEVRLGAASLKGKLVKDHPCPYCNGHLGSKPHADHIHPVSKGGLSTERNLVYVCGQCNRRKKDRTLNQFIDMTYLNRSMVYGRLSQLGKDY